MPSGPQAAATRRELGYDVIESPGRYSERAQLINTDGCGSLFILEKPRISDSVRARNLRWIAPCASGRGVMPNDYRRQTHIMSGSAAQPVASSRAESRYGRGDRTSAIMGLWWQSKYHHRPIEVLTYRDKVSRQAPTRRAAGCRGCFRSWLSNNRDATSLPCRSGAAVVSVDRRSIALVRC